MCVTSSIKTHSLFFPVVLGFMSVSLWDVAPTDTEGQA